MEIIACTAALEEAMRQQLTLAIKEVIVLTDSKYVSEHYKEAMFEWSRNRWLRKTGRPVPDAHLWKDLVKQLKIYNNHHTYVDIQWIKSSEKDEHIKAVDEMAKKASKLPLGKMPKNTPVTIFQPRKIVSSPKMEIGNVLMKSERISIKILSCKLLKPQNLWCYQYQVISKKSTFRGLVDQIFSSISLDTNKSYYVKFNSATENPRIEKLYWEIK
jgi:ribonuclease HI